MRLLRLEKRLSEMTGRLIPQSMDEFLERFHTNAKVTGYGIDNMDVHIPCPFCAAPDFMCYKTFQTESTMMKGATCSQCGRSAKAIFAANPEVGFEIIQTGGDDQPTWLEPKIRKLA